MDWPPDHPLPLSVLCVTASRSGGPGGQHVNKVNTRATLTVAWEDLRAHLPEALVQRLCRTAPHLCTRQGIRINSDTHRSLLRNKQACMQRLLGLISDAGRTPSARRATRPSRGSVRRRLEAKRQRSQRKADRRSLD